MSAPRDDDDRRARVALSRLAEPGDPDVVRLVREYGAAEVLAAVRRGAASTGDTLLARLQARLPVLDVDRDLERLAAVDGRVVCPADEEWPPSLDDLGPTVPLLLWVRGQGHLRRLAEQAVAVVGTRAATHYGTHVASGMAAELAEQRWSIVSGGAYGIDAAAHRGALAAHGATVVVLACGVDVTYPRGHAGLFRAALADGVLVSELPPGSAPHRVRFLTRNRLIAALSAGTIVVEAAVRSGTRRTARDARALGRPVMVVPGPVTSAASAGCHELLRDDEPSVLVTGAPHVLEVVGRLGADLAPVARGPVTPRDGLPPDAARVLDALPVRRGQGPARLAGTAGVPLAVVEHSLGLLVLHGLAERVEGGWRLSPAARRPATE